MAVMFFSLCAVSYMCVKRILEYHAIRDSPAVPGKTPSFEGQPMPHDMNALMWYDL